MAMHSTSAPSIAPHGGTGATTGRRRRGGGTRSTESAGHQRIQRAPAHLQNAEPRSWCHMDIFDSSEDSWGFFTKKKNWSLLQGYMELTFRENVNRAQHVNCAQCNLHVRISQYIRFIYGLVSHIHCTGRWYETEVRNSATCLLSDS